VRWPEYAGSSQYLPEAAPSLSASDYPSAVKLKGRSGGLFLDCVFYTPWGREPCDRRERYEYYQPYPYWQDAFLEVPLAGWLEAPYNTEFFGAQIFVMLAWSRPLVSITLLARPWKANQCYSPGSSCSYSYSSNTEIRRKYEVAKGEVPASPQPGELHAIRIVTEGMWGEADTMALPPLDGFYQFQVVLEFPIGSGGTRQFSYDVREAVRVNPASWWGYTGYSKCAGCRDYPPPPDWE